MDTKMLLTTLVDIQIELCARNDDSSPYKKGFHDSEFFKTSLTHMKISKRENPS